MTNFSSFVSVKLQRVDDVSKLASVCAISVERPAAEGRTESVKPIAAAEKKAASFEKAA